MASGDATVICGEINEGLVCGNENKRDSKFCSECGAKVPKSSPSQPLSQTSDSGSKVITPGIRPTVSDDSTRSPKEQWQFVAVQHGQVSCATVDFGFPESKVGADEGFDTAVDHATRETTVIDMEIIDREQCNDKSSPDKRSENRKHDKTSSEAMCITIGSTVDAQKEPFSNQQEKEVTIAVSVPCKLDSCHTGSTQEEHSYDTGASDERQSRRMASTDPGILNTCTSLAKSHLETDNRSKTAGDEDPERRRSSSDAASPILGKCHDSEGNGRQTHRYDKKSPEDLHSLGRREHNAAAVGGEDISDSRSAQREDSSGQGDATADDHISEACAVANSSQQSNDVDAQHISDTESLVPPGLHEEEYDKEKIAEISKNLTKSTLKRKKKKVPTATLR